MAVSLYIAAMLLITIAAVVAARNVADRAATPNNPKSAIVEPGT